MTGTRVVTALALFLFCLWALFWAPAWVFTGFIVLVLAASAWEWARLCGVPVIAAFAYTLLLLALLVAGRYWAWLGAPTLWMLVAAAWWPVVLIQLRLFRVTPLSAIGRISGLLAGIPTLLPLSVAALYLYQINPFWLLWCMLMVMAADIGAYFCGRRWGDTKLAPQISPGKTWAGLWGGLAASMAVGLLGSVLIDVAWVSLIGLGFGLLVAVLGTLGDLNESMLKRQAGCKDSGSLLPGHGGALDRIDSLTAALPIFALGLELLRWI